MNRFIGIDIGASFIKGAVFDMDDLVVRYVVKVSSPQPRRGTLSRHETNPVQYRNLTKQLIKKLLKRAGKSVKGIVLSGQMHGMVLADNTNKAVTQFIGWQDERMLEKSKVNGVSWIDLYKKKLKGINTRTTGITLRAGLSGITLFWLKEQGILKKHPSGQLLSIGDYIAATLTDGRRLMHPTQACGTALFDVKKNDWDKNILTALGIARRHLPEVAKSGAVVGYYPSGNKKVPVYPCIGDLQSAVLGSMISGDTLSINIGTGSQVSVISPSYVRGDYDLRSYFDGMFLKTVPFIPAGRSLNVIIRFLEEIGKKIYTRKDMDIWDKLHSLISTKRDSDGVESRISFFAGNATGFETGYWQGITEKNLTVENMVYSAFENMAQNYWTAYRRLRPRGIKRVILSGGLARKSLVLQKLIKKRFSLRVGLSSNTEETLIGLLVCALVSSGRMPNIRAATLYCRKQGVRVQPK